MGYIQDNLTIRFHVNCTHTGCFCPSGMVEHGDECVTPEQCPTGATEEPTEPECPEGKVYQDCGTSCPKTCDNKDELTLCIFQCVEGRR